MTDYTRLDVRTQPTAVSAALVRVYTSLESTLAHARQRKPGQVYSSPGFMVAGQGAGCT